MPTIGRVLRDPKNPYHDASSRGRTTIIKEVLRLKLSAASPNSIGRKKPPEMAMIRKEDASLVNVPRPSIARE